MVVKLHDKKLFIPTFYLQNPAPIDEFFSPNPIALAKNATFWASSLSSICMLTLLANNYTPLYTNLSILYHTVLYLYNQLFYLIFIKIKFENIIASIKYF